MRKVPKFLQVLLESKDVDSAEYQAAVAQLERQPQWQPALEKLALGDAQWWPEARSALVEGGLPESGREHFFAEAQRAEEFLHTVDSSPAENAQPTPFAPVASITVEIESSLASDTPIDCERVSLDFLDPPRHPELLGRIDRYEIERVLGTGGMGIVLRAFDTDLHRVVAIKVLASHLAHNSSARRRFAREAQAAAAVVHPHVIPIFNVESDAKTPYIVMHYVAGQSLQRRVDVDGPLPTVEALRIAQQTAAGLTAAHAQGLVHRDVKPANILLEEQIDRVMLSDFGLARAVDDASLTKTGIVAGTPHYMSPEQALGEAIDHRSDLFSLGSVLYFMLCGHPPFRASSAMAVLHRICQFEHRPLIEVNRDVPIEVSQLVDRLLAKKPENRPATAADADHQLAQLLNNLQQRGVSIQSAHDTGNTSSFPSADLRTLAGKWLVRAAGVLACAALIALGRVLPDWSTHWSWLTPSNETVATDLTPQPATPVQVSEFQVVDADSVTELNAVRNEYGQWLRADQLFTTERLTTERLLRELDQDFSQSIASQDDFTDQLIRLKQLIEQLEKQFEADLRPKF